MLSACGQAGSEPGALEEPGGSWANMAALINQGISAVKAVSSSTKIMIHLDPGGSRSTTSNWISKFIANGGAWSSVDAMGFSCYPMWQGSFSNLQSVLSEMRSSYSSKKVRIAETAYYWTTNQAGHGGSQVPSCLEGLPPWQPFWLDAAAASAARGLVLVRRTHGKARPPVTRARNAASMRAGGPRRAGRRPDGYRVKPGRGAGRFRRRRRARSPPSGEPEVVTALGWKVRAPDRCALSTLR